MIVRNTDSIKGTSRLKLDIKEAQTILGFRNLDF